MKSVLSALPESALRAKVEVEVCDLVRLAEARNAAEERTAQYEAYLNGLTEVVKTTKAIDPEKAIAEYLGIPVEECEWSTEYRISKANE